MSQTKSPKFGKLHLWFVRNYNQIVFYLCQKSLPKLNKKIEEKLWDVKNELKDYETGPPEDPEAAKQFLVEVGPQVITSSCLGEL